MPLTTPDVLEDGSRNQIETNKNMARSLSVSDLPTRESLNGILTELRIMNLHLSKITGLAITADDVGV